ncbi:hypothetical protein TVAG_474300 [Trichomonas vaginalis G3]|uniref:Uncharacterized protein n=1 Tax=Trichomonas vaginalis (strain ATCC PRA-98 / G3) TaxID=412133 RepID=A2ESW7_TRIV3|nr:hypothetical protein TVAGG3_0191890 [Trichomonas vaginalis G3]EAY04225.1 hypothetical protein TVAG_474300 [Trichomonas vaginalis G3]KAI5550035.1 hypothetical protein TVAGG3_0191890 [Trichomonas vaginalis G3]|eukprot:XP_001316448.1 hypothetical protein [Trichomonas vaginalis G3]
MFILFCSICKTTSNTFRLSRSWEEFYPDTPYNQAIETKDPFTYQTNNYYYINNVIFDNLTSQAIYGNSVAIHTVIEDSTFTYITSTSTSQGGAIYLTNSIELNQKKICSCNCWTKNSGQYMYLSAGYKSVKTILSSFTSCGNLSSGNGILAGVNVMNYATNLNFSKCETYSASAFSYNYCKNPSNISFGNFEHCASKLDSVLKKSGSLGSHYLQINDCTIYNCSVDNKLIYFEGATSILNSNFINNVLRTSTSPTLIYTTGRMIISSCYIESNQDFSAANFQTSDLRDSALELNNQYYIITKCIEFKNEEVKKTFVEESNVIKVYSGREKILIEPILIFYSC